MRPSANELLKACEEFGKKEAEADKRDLYANPLIVGLGKKYLVKDLIGEKRWLEEGGIFAGWKDEECVHLVIKTHRLWALALYLGQKGYDVPKPWEYEWSPTRKVFSGRSVLGSKEYTHFSGDTLYFWVIPNEEGQ